MNERNDTQRSKDPAELERDIDQTRGRLEHTIDALESRLSPGQMLDRALGMAREQGGDFATNLGRSVRNNPMPVILTSVGLAWMMAASNEPRAAPRSRVGNVSGKVSNAKSRLQTGAESAKSAAASVGDGAARARHTLEDTAGHARERLQMQKERLSGGFRHLMKDQPLLAGALGIAVGAALGAALPRTESEERLMGDASEETMQSAKEKAAQAYGEARDKAAAAAEEAVSASEQAMRRSAEREDGGSSKWQDSQGA